MKKGFIQLMVISLLTTVLMILFLQKTIAQEVAKPFTARAYWLEEQDPTFKSINSKVDQNIPLTEEEKEYLDYYEDHLSDYFNRLSQSEKERYRIFKPQWDEEVQSQVEAEPSDILEENARGIIPGKKYKLYNGIYGGIYGAMLIPLLGIEENNIAYGLPFLMAGGSLLLPVINPKKYDNMNYNSVLLNRHGKMFGLFDGGMLSLLILGGESEGAGKGFLALSMAGSIGMGELGFQMGKRVDWTEGRIAGYNHYAAVMPLFALGMYASFVNFDEEFDEREFAGIMLLSGAAGYLTGNSLWKKFNYTRGDILATSSFTILSALTGFGLIGEIETEDDQKEILIPALAFLAGSVGSHSILKGKNLSVKDGWRINYVTGAGALLGLGIALAIQSDSVTPYLLLPALGGYVGWGVMLGSVVKNPSRASAVSGNKFSYSINPLSYFLNKSLSRSYFTPDHPGAPLISLKLTL